MSACGATAILVPTYRRAARVAPLLAGIREATGPAHAVYFVVEGHDAESLAAVREAGGGLIVNPGQPSYASCINAAYRATTEPFLFVGADDLEFTRGWLEAALDTMADPRVGVVGTADRETPTDDHATHYLVRRRYIEEQGGCMDRRDLVLYPYAHNYADCEIVCTAKARDAYAFCAGSLVLHHHPGWAHDGTVRRDHPLFDATYAKGNRCLDEDRRLFTERARLWMDRLDPDNAANRQILAIVRGEGPRDAAWKRWLKRHLPVPLLRLAFRIRGLGRPATNRGGP